MVAATNDEAARWQAWEHGCRSSSEQAARHARIAFAILLTGAAVWLGLQIMSMPV
jgi:hypothetical protein